MHMISTLQAGAKLTTPQQVLRLVSGWCCHINRHPAVPASSFAGLQAQAHYPLQDCFDAGAAIPLEAQRPPARA